MRVVTASAGAENGSSIGDRHLDGAQGDAPTGAISKQSGHDLTVFYDAVARLVATADWCRVRGAPGYVTVTVARRGADQMISPLVAAAERANPGWWRITESPYPDVI